MIGELTISIIDRADEQGRLRVWHDRSIPGDRPVFDCTLESMGEVLYRSTDIGLGMGDEPNHVTAMRALVTFLEAEAETYRHAMSAGATDSESVERRTGDGYIFNERTAEWAYMLDEQLALARLELELFPDDLMPVVVKALEVASTSPAMGEAATDALAYLRGSK